MESKREHFESNPIIFPGITLNSEQILVLTLDLVGSMIGFYQKCSIFDSTIHMGGVTIRKRTVLLTNYHITNPRGEIFHTAVASFQVTRVCVPNQAKNMFKSVAIFLNVGMQFPIKIFVSL